MTRKLLIVLVNTDPRNPEELGAPFYHAAVAAAMDYEVDVICAATAGKLMRRGVAEAIRIKPGHAKTVYDWIRDAHRERRALLGLPRQPRSVRHDRGRPDPRVQGTDGRRRHAAEHHVRRLSRADLLRRPMALVEGQDYPEHLYYDLDNQVWYEALDDGTVRAGFTPLAIALAGDVLVFTPKRVGRDFEAQRSFATIECGKWVGAARAAFDGDGRGRERGAGAPAQAAQRGRLRGRLDADRAPRGHLLARSPRDRCRHRSRVRRLDRGGGLQGPGGIVANRNAAELTRHPCQRHPRAGGDPRESRPLVG